MNTVNLSLASCLRPTVLRVALAAALIPLTAALPAHAGDAPADGPPLQTVVHYADLNLDSNADTLALYQRLAAAARKACPDDSASEPQSQATRACRAEAIARAIREIDSVKLTAMQTEWV